jgi:hypothetical protein
VAKVFGYTNDTNPFGDSNLLQPFVWGKKKDKDKNEGKVEKDDEESRLKLMKDIDRVRKRRVDRENELEEMERLRAEETRLREASSYENWEEKEEEFHTQQTKVRSKIRLIERREKPIDILARHILLIESFNSTDKEEMDLGSSLAALENLHVELSEPLRVVEQLDEEELLELVTDLDKYLEIEVKNSGTYVEFWTALKDVTSAALQQRKNRSSGVHKSVKNDVKKIMGGKVSKDLKLLLEDIRKSIREGKRSDVEYWEQMEREVALEHSRAIVREVHRDLLRQQMDIVTRYKEVSIALVLSCRVLFVLSCLPCLDEHGVLLELKRCPFYVVCLLNKSSQELKLKRGYKTDAEREQEEKEAAARLDYRFISSSGGGGGGDRSSEASREHGSAQNITEYMKDVKAQDRADEARAHLPQQDDSEQALALQQAERGKGLGASEEAMATQDEVAMQARFYHWQDKYRPRKPRHVPCMCCITLCHVLCCVVWCGVVWCGVVHLSALYLSLSTVLIGVFIHVCVCVYAMCVSVCILQVLQPGEDRVRLEQVQLHALRPRQPAAQDGAGLQVQRLLPGPDRQDQHASVLRGGLRGPAVCHSEVGIYLVCVSMCLCSMRMLMVMVIVMLMVMLMLMLLPDSTPDPPTRTWPSKSSTTSGRSAGRAASSASSRGECCSSTSTSRDTGTEDRYAEEERRRRRRRIARRVE